jgi:hypothetical protein
MTRLRLRANAQYGTVAPPEMNTPTLDRLGMKICQGLMDKDLAIAGISSASDTTKSGVYWLL